MLFCGNWFTGKSFHNEFLSGEFFSGVLLKVIKSMLGVSTQLVSLFLNLAALLFLSVSASASESNKTIEGTTDSDEGNQCPALFDHKMKQLHSSQTLDLCQVVAGRPVLLVNTASHCGFTGQLADLERIHKTYKNQGLVVIGVASDSFNQEADNEGEIAEVCFKNFGVSFTMLAPVSVKGDSAHPLYQAIAAQDNFPSWNFFKYLIDRKGQVVSSSSSFRIPTDDELQTLLTM